MRFILVTDRAITFYTFKRNNPLLALNLNRNLPTNAPHAEEPLIKEVTWKLTFSPIQTSSPTAVAAAERCFGATVTCDGTVWRTAHTRSTSLHGQTNKSMTNAQRGLLRSLAFWSKTLSKSGLDCWLQRDLDFIEASLTCKYLEHVHNVLFMSQCLWNDIVWTMLNCILEINMSYKFKWFWSILPITMYKY